jgi:chloramphenicol 3-O phosphotransferase
MDKSRNFSPEKQRGEIIFLNGTSSSGKTTLARELQKALPIPFCHYASDQLADAGFRPLQEQRATDLGERDRFFDGFHRSIAAFAAAGNNLIVEHIVEQMSWADDIQRLLTGFHTFWVGVHAPIEELERRELERGDRYIGEARYHLKTHDYCKYDTEVRSTDALSVKLDRIVSAWRATMSPPLKAL